MSDDQKYPVFIEHTERWLVWVEADNAEQAAAQVSNEPYEYISDEDRIDGDMNATAPQTGWEWQDVYGWEAKQQDAHVRAHKDELRRQAREAERKACTAEGHPDLEAPIYDGRRWCKRCAQYLPAVQTVTTTGGAL